MPVAPPAPVVPDGPTVVEPVLPDVLPAAPAFALPDVVPGAVALPDEPDMPEPVVEPPDMAPPLELALPVEGEAVVLGVVLMVVDAPGDVVSAARRSQPATSAVSAAVANINLVSLETDCMEISQEF